VSLLRYSLHPFEPGQCQWQTNFLVHSDSFFRLFIQKVRTFKKISFGVVHRRKVTSSSAAVSHQVGCKI
jgi:hypothetical protein